MQLTEYPQRTLYAAREARAPPMVWATATAGDAAIIMKEWPPESREEPQEVKLSPNPSGSKGKNERTFARVLPGHSSSRILSKSRKLEWLDDLERCRNALQAIRAAKKIAAKHSNALGDLIADLNKAEFFLAKVVKSSPNAKKAADKQNASQHHRQSSFEMAYNIVRRGQVYADVLQRIWEWIERLNNSRPN